MKAIDNRVDMVYNINDMEIKSCSVYIDGKDKFKFGYWNEFESFEMNNLSFDELTNAWI